MKQRFYLFCGRGTFYLQDSRTGQQQSLDTKDRPTALRLPEVKRQSMADIGFNLRLLKACLTTQDGHGVGCLCGRRRRAGTMESFFIRDPWF
ncbi:MAG: hypothetical protein WAO02_10835 [Verrucomicrobiia bacterium]